MPRRMGTLDLGEPRIVVHRGEPWCLVDVAADPDNPDPEELWTVAMRLWMQGAELVVSELRVYPLELRPRGAKSVPPGTWRVPRPPSPTVAGWALEPVPWGGITRRLVHRLPMDALRQLSARELARLPKAFRDRATVALGSLPPVPPTRPRRHPAFYARLAVAYGRRVAAGTRAPVKEIAEEMGARTEQVRDWLHEARRRGLLTKTEPGKKGGRPTDEALRLVVADKG